MAINKVEFDGQTLIDLTGDTVTQQDVLNGKSFHTPDGVQRSGTASIPVSDVTVDGTSVVTNGVAEVVTDNLAPTVTEASSRTNLAVGDSLKTIIGKIKKFFSDLKTVAFSGSYNDLSDKPTIPDISTKVSKSGDTMTGLLKFSTYGFRTYQDWGYDIGDSGNFHHLRNSQWDNWQIKKYDTTEALTYTFERGELTNYGDVIINHKDGTASAAGTTVLSLGNNIAEGTDKNSKGLLRIYSNTAKKTDITAPSLTDNRTLSLPNNSGTIALTSDIPTNNNQLANGAGYITAAGSCASATSAGHLSPLGTKVNSTTWGTITSANGYTQLYCTNQPGGGGYVVGEKGGQTSIQIDGDWYGQEGAKRCAYTSEALMKAGDTITGNLNIGSGGGYLNASASNGGINSILIGDDVWLGDCNLGGIMGMKSTGANCGFRFYNSKGTHIGTLQSTAGTLQFNNSNVLVDGGTINITHQINMKNGAGIVLYNAANNNYTDLYNSANGTTFLRAAYGWVNLCTNNSVQCRNFGDSNWVPCAGLRFDNKSSRRYKTNIIDFEEKDAKKLLSIKVVHYDYSDEVTKDKNNKYNQSGVIAEDVASIIPEVVGYAIPYGHEDEFDEPVPDTVDYSKFVPYLIKMVQMQQKEIDQLKAEVAELKR